MLGYGMAHTLGQLVGGKRCLKAVNRGLQLGCARRDFIHSATKPKHITNPTVREPANGCTKPFKPTKERVEFGGNAVARLVFDQQYLRSVPKVMP